MTAFCEVFKDAMEYWNKVERGAQDAVATEGQKVIGAIAAASAYNKQYGSVGSRSAPRTRRTGPGKRTLIEFCTDADSSMGNVGLNVSITEKRIEELGITDIAIAGAASASRAIIAKSAAATASTLPTARSASPCLRSRSRTSSYSSNRQKAARLRPRRVLLHRHLQATLSPSRLRPKNRAGRQPQGPSSAVISIRGAR